MYEIRTPESPDPLRAIQQVEEAAATMPRPEYWLVPDQVSLLANGPAGPAGAVLLTPCRRNGIRVAKYRLDWLYVLPQNRNAGLGRQLMERAAMEAARKGATAIQITLNPDHHTLLPWFASLPSVPGVGYVLSLVRRAAM